MSYIWNRIFESIKGSIRKYIHSVNILDWRTTFYLKYISNQQDALKLCTLLGLHCTSIFCTKFVQNLWHSDQNTAWNIRKNECTLYFNIPHEVCSKPLTLRPEYIMEYTKKRMYIVLQYSARGLFKTFDTPTRIHHGIHEKTNVHFHIEPPLPFFRF